jgi:uncharacterized protein (DUF952 family)
VSGPATILHLVPEPVWRSLPPAGTWAPPSLAAEGFVHCTGDDELMLQVANRFYADQREPVVVLSLAVERLRADVRWEPPAHPDGSSPGEGLRFPHVYGPLDLDAVVAVRRLTRAGDRYVGYEAVSD